MEHIFNTQFYRSNFGKGTFSVDVKKRSDKLMNYFLAGYFLIGLLFGQNIAARFIIVSIRFGGCLRCFYGTVYLPDARHVRDAFFCLYWQCHIDNLPKME